MSMWGNGHFRMYLITMRMHESEPQSFLKGSFGNIHYSLKNVLWLSTSRYRDLSQGNINIWKIECLCLCPPKADPETKFYGWVLYCSVMPGRRSEGRGAKEGRKESQLMDAILIQSPLWAKSCLILQGHPGSHMICVSVFLSEGKRGSMYVPAPISHWANVHLTGS